MEHSAMLLTCIKRSLVLKTDFGLYASGPFTQAVLFVNTSFSIGVLGGGVGMWNLVVSVPGQYFLYHIKQ